MQSYQPEEWDPSTYEPEPEPELPRWKRGGVGDSEWETRNNQLMEEWLRFADRIVEFGDAQREKTKRDAPPGWARAQVERFCRTLELTYGQTLPDGEWISERVRRVAARQDDEAKAALESRWAAAMRIAGKAHSRRATVPTKRFQEQAAGTVPAEAIQAFMRRTEPASATPRRMTAEQLDMELAKAGGT